MNRRKDVQNKDLEVVIAAWERDMDTSLEATGEGVSATTQHMLLLDMCSLTLR